METQLEFGICISSLYVVVFISSIYFAFMSTNMSTFTLVSRTVTGWLVYSSKIILSAPNGQGTKFNVWRILLSKCN